MAAGSTPCSNPGAREGNLDENGMEDEPPPASCGCLPRRILRRRSAGEASRHGDELCHQNLDVSRQREREGRRERRWLPEERRTVTQLRQDVWPVADKPAEGGSPDWGGVWERAMAGEGQETRRGGAARLWRGDGRRRNLALPSLILPLS